MDIKTLLLSLIGGIGITTVTGLIKRKVLVGATHYGWPLAWLMYLTLAPEYYPWSVRPIWFVIDAVLWGLVVLIIVHYARRR